MDDPAFDVEVTAGSAVHELSRHECDSGKWATCRLGFLRWGRQAHMSYVLEILWPASHGDQVGLSSWLIINRSYYFVAYLSILVGEMWSLLVG